MKKLVGLDGGVAISLGMVLACPQSFTLTPARRGGRSV